jgi:nucleoside 2-deoxyribosyltransferase
MLSDINNLFLFNNLPSNGVGFSVDRDKIPDFSLISILNNTGDVILSFYLSNNFFNTNSLSIERANDLKTLFTNAISFQNNALVDESYIINFIDENYPSRLPNDKLNRVLGFLYSSQSYDGQQINLIISRIKKEELYRKMFLKNHEEFLFYLDTLKNLGLIKLDTNSYNIDIQFTISGLSKIISNNEELKSNQCFVAMSFDQELFDVYDFAIKPAITQTGFKPIIIREDKSIPSDVTINDAILAAIKQSKFTIADFTGHKKGVYFEAGYALGRGHKVIYSCKSSEIDKAHFDTRNYPHIVWNDLEDLKKQLIDKIEVFIKS